MDFEDYDVDKDLMGKGLEEALKYQLNLVGDAVRHNLVNQFQGRCDDFEMLRGKVQVAKIDTEEYTHKYDELRIKYADKQSR